MRRTAIRSAVLMSLAAVPAALTAACGGDTIIFDNTGGGGTGGSATSTGGQSTGGQSTGGQSTGGQSTGGQSTGGQSTGGQSTGGGNTGGQGGSGGCGDGVAGPGEECDGADFNGASCFDYGFSAAAGLSCNPDCSISSAGCMPICHSGLLEPGEQCDETDLGAADCTSYGYVNPMGLACNDTCDGFVTDGCTAACNGTLEPDETCDGANLNGHTCGEFGFSNPDGLACVACMLDSSACKPTCGDGKQEPGEACDDGNLQSGDGCSPTCTVEGGTTCADAVKVTLNLGTQNFTGTTAGGGLHNGVCASAGPDRVYAITAAATGFLTASLTRANTSYPSVLYARTTCDNVATEILCADSKDPVNPTPLNGGEVLSFPVNQNQLIYLFVDGAAANDAGNYELVLDLSTGVNCQDPVPVRIEAGSPMRLLGLTTGKTPSTNGTCGGGGPGFGGEDVVYDIQFGTGGQSTIALDAAGTNYNSVLYLRNECNNGFNQISCDNAGGNGGESLNINATANTSVWTWVDGNMGASGNYAMVVTPVP